MATITTRSGKGSPLTNNEVDANFTNLNTDKAELSGATFTGQIVAPSLDISGNIDVDGTTNLDVVDIDGAVDMASSLTLSTNSNAISMKDASGGTTRMFILNSGNTTYLGPVDSYAGGAMFYGASANVTGHNMYVGGADRFSISSSGVVVNEASADADFRVESNGNANMLFVDGGNNHVGIGTATLNRSGLGTDHICLTVGADNQMGMLELQATRTSNADLGRVSFLNAGTRRAEIVAARVDEDNSTKLYFQTSNAGSLGTKLTIGKDGAATFSSSVTSTGLISGSLLNPANNSLTILGGGSATNNGANLTMYGGSAASSAGDFRFRNGTTETARITAAGAATFSGDVSVPNISVADDIRHTGDSDTYISFESNNQTY